MGFATGAVLVVDDYADSREALREMLEDLGHHVIEAANGQEALNFLIFHPEAKVNLILLDLQMPVMNGWELLEVLRNYVRLARIPVLVVSAYTSTLPPEQQSYVAGCLQAPYEMPRLQAMVEAIAGQSGTSPAG
jgi:CheY-like chemotaxis protein